MFITLYRIVIYRNIIHDPAVIYNNLLHCVYKGLKKPFVPLRFICPNLPHLKTIVSRQNVFSCNECSVISGKCWISSVLRNKVKTSMITSTTNWRGRRMGSGSWLTTSAGVFLIRYVTFVHKI